MITYQTNVPVSVAQYVELLNKTTLGARRPLADLDRVAAMLHHADLLITAWVAGELIGAARSVTDFAYCCYLSDLAVAENWQGQGVGKALIAQTQQALHPQCKLILLSAPQAVDYYPHIGFQAHPSAWVK